MNVIDKPSKYSKEYLAKLFKYSLGEDIANVVTHMVGVIFSIYALISLINTATMYGDTADIVSFIAYGISMLCMFLMSTLYHSMVNHTARIVMKRMDHIAIYLLIVGSYTPYVFSLLRTKSAYIIYILIVACAILGIIFKALYAGKFTFLSTALYILMGWCCVYLLPQIWHNMPIIGLWLFVASGITYTIGALLYALVRFKYIHMIWHIMVLGAVVLMFISINFFILQYR